MDIGALVVVTGSMEPTINIKEMIIIKESNIYSVKDIVTYRDKNNNLVTHRIISKSGNTLVTRGDNNTVSDEPVDISKVEGKVLYHSLVLGEIFLYWIKPILIIIITILSMNLIKTMVLLRRNRYEEKNN